MISKVHAIEGFRNDGIAQPNKFEVILSCPTGTRGSQRGSGASLNNIFSLLMGKVNSMVQQDPLDLDVHKSHSLGELWILNQIQTYTPN